jgi:hypothetical protein
LIGVEEENGEIFLLKKKKILKYNSKKILAKGKKVVSTIPFNKNIPKSIAPYSNFYAGKLF